MGLQGDVRQFPASAAMGFDVIVGFFVVGEAHVGAIPKQFFVGEAPTDRAKQNPFRIGAEIGRAHV